MNNYNEFFGYMSFKEEITDKNVINAVTTYLKDNGYETSPENINKASEVIVNYCTKTLNKMPRNWCAAYNTIDKQSDNLKANMAAAMKDSFPQKEEGNDGTQTEQSQTTEEAPTTTTSADTSEQPQTTEEVKTAEDKAVVDEVEKASEVAEQKGMTAEETEKFISDYLNKYMKGNNVNNNNITINLNDLINKKASTNSSSEEDSTNGTSIGSSPSSKGSIGGLSADELKALQTDKESVLNAAANNLKNSNNGVFKVTNIKVLEKKSKISQYQSLKEANTTGATKVNFVTEISGITPPDTTTDEDIKNAFIELISSEGGFIDTLNSGKNTAVVNSTIDNSKWTGNKKATGRYNFTIKATLNQDSIKVVRDEQDKGKAKISFSVNMISGDGKMLKRDIAYKAAKGTAKGVGTVAKAAVKGAGAVAKGAGKVLSTVGKGIGNTLVAMAQDGANTTSKVLR